MNDSRKLLQDYAYHGEEDAFRELVARYVNMVHSTALRLVNGDSHLAEDVTQTVFLNLARNASTLSKQVMIGGWLHRNTCFVALTMIRGDRRRQKRERQAVEMNSAEDHSVSNLAVVAPLLDEAINELAAEDRTAILLRFFEQHEFRAVGEIMGSNENAARMRVNRALEKLHEILKRRGVVLSAAALGTALAAEAVTAAPTGMAAIAAAAALGGAASKSATLTIIKAGVMTKTKIALAAAIVAALAVSVVQHQTIRALRAENNMLKQQVAQIASLQHQQVDAAQDAAKTVRAPLTDPQMRELARLRNEVARLREQTNELAKARLQIQALNRPAPASGDPGAGMVIASPSGIFPGSAIQIANQITNICITNLRLIEEAKEKWASENQKQNGDTPTMEDLRPYFGHGPDGARPNGTQALLGNGTVVELDLAHCPDGGVYKLGTVSEKPTCSISGHVLP